MLRKEPFPPGIIDGFHRWIGIIWIIGLAGLQSIPGTGALRTLFLLVGIVHVALLSRKIAWPDWRSIPIDVLGLCFLLIVWLATHSMLLATDSTSSTVQFLGEWYKISLMTLVGLCLVFYTNKHRTNFDWVALAIFGSQFLHVISTIAYQPWAWFRGIPGLQNSFLGNYGYVSPFVTGALALLLADGVMRLRGGRWLPISNVSMGLALAATLIAHILLNAKASIVVAALLFITTAIIITLHSGKRIHAFVFVLCCFLLIGGSLMFGNRWQGATEAIATVIHQPADFTTLSGTSDTNAPVNRLENSFYARAAWAKISLQGIVEHPLGLGYGADAFGRYVVERGGPPGVISSHSGWLDFALANGLPGITLLILFFIALMRAGCHSFHNGNPAGLALLLVVLNFFARSVLDGNLAGSRFTGFFFVAATLLGLSLQSSKSHD